MQEHEKKEREEEMIQENIQELKVAFTEYKINNLFI